MLLKQIGWRPPCHWDGVLIDDQVAGHPASKGFFCTIASMTGLFACIPRQHIDKYSPSTLCLAQASQLASTISLLRANACAVRLDCQCVHALCFHACTCT